MLNKKVFINNVMYKNSLNNYKLKRFSSLNTSLHLVVANKRLNVINILLSKKMNSSIKNSKEKLVFKKAKYYDWSEVINRFRLLSWCDFVIKNDKQFLRLINISKIKKELRRDNEKHWNDALKNLKKNKRC